MSVPPSVMLARDVTVEVKEMFATVPFVEGMFKASKRTLYVCDIRVTFRPVSTLWHLLTTLKDPISIPMWCIVYLVRYVGLHMWA